MPTARGRDAIDYEREKRRRNEEEADQDPRAEWPECPETESTVIGYFKHGSRYPGMLFDLGLQPSDFKNWGRQCVAQTYWEIVQAGDLPTEYAVINRLRDTGKYEDAADALHDGILQNRLEPASREDAE